TYKAPETFYETKTCSECLTRIKESKKRKYEENFTSLPDSKENIIDVNNITDVIYKALANVKDIDENLESSCEFYFEQAINLDMLINEIPADIEENKYEHYLASKIELVSKRQKHSDISKQQNTGSYIIRYACEGLLSIAINLTSNCANIKLSHKQLHQRPKYTMVSEQVKQYVRKNLVLRASELHHEIISKKLDGFETLTIDQVYFWWAREASKYYRRHENQYQSAKLLLHEKGFKVILDLNQPTHVFGFLTSFFNKLPHIAFETIMVDATYNTNQLKYELYAVMAIIDGTGFPILYCFIESGKGRDIRAAIITSWFKFLYENGLKEVKTILSDKDFAQISSGMTIWKNVEIQLCKWHLRRAIEQKLSSKFSNISSNYNAITAHQQCSKINPTWQPTQSTNLGSKKVFLEASLRKEILEYIDTHFHRHMLIPTADKVFVSTSNEIWYQAVNEIFQYCYHRNLFHVWCYLWQEWYRWDRWCLWALSAHKNGSIFNRPRLDVLCYVITNRMLPKLMHHYNLLVTERIQPSWRKDFANEWKKFANREIKNSNKYFTNHANWVQCNNKYPFLYEAQQTIWQTIKNDLPNALANPEIEHCDYEKAEMNLKEILAK
ncbi:299_t:CDS:2, partial [Gigaspora rosea]